MAFIKLASLNELDQTNTGKRIVALSESAFSSLPNSEWAQFQADPRGWLHDAGYIWADINGDIIGDGHIPPEVEIVPVYDSPNRMHVRIPWKGDIAAAKVKPVEATPSYAVSFPILLARYFMRKCR